jgi:hypothetical protein
MSTDDKSKDKSNGQANEKGNGLVEKLEELRKLAAGSRKKLTEITTGITLLRGEVRELGTLLGVAPAVDHEEAEHDFDEIQPTSARLSRHDA